MINPKLLKATIEIVEAAEDYVDDEFNVIKGHRLECAVRNYQKVRSELEQKRIEENRRCPFVSRTPQAQRLNQDECLYYLRRLDGSCQHNLESNLCMSEERQRVIDSKKDNKK